MILFLTDNVAIRNGLLDYLAAKDWKYDIACSPGSGIANELSIKADPAALVAKYELIVSAHCKQIFPAELVERVLCVNLHPGYNPQTRGWHAQTFAILKGLAFGFTVHVMDRDIDAGEIILRETVPLYFDDTSKSAYLRLLDREVASFDRWLPGVVGRNYPTFKPEEAGNYHSLKDVRALHRIDLDQVGTFGEFYDRLRALSFPPHRNAYVVDPGSGRKIFLDLVLSREDEQ